MTHHIPGGTQPKRSNWTKWLLPFALLMISACVGAILWIYWQTRSYEPFTARDHFPSLHDIDYLPSIEGNAEIELPSTAHDIYAYTTGFRDIFIKVRFSMNPDDLDHFIENTLCQEPLRQMEPGPQSTLDGTSEWWLPHHAAYLKGCAGTRDRSRQTVMIDMTHPDVYIVYVTTSTY